MITKETISAWFENLQDDICHSLELLDGKGVFQEDLWQREGGGGGRTRVIIGSEIEKGGVNFSAVHGPLHPSMAKALEVADSDFFATGVSIVLHPKNPMVPIIHMNVRYFETSDETWWFGGGIDITPHYIFDADAIKFHNTLKSVCDRHHSDYYGRYKAWADDYFFIKHRNETRGIGGIFFDKLSSPEISKELAFEFVKDVGSSFIPIYSEVFNNNVHKSYETTHRDWQLLRRGRYVEFNLVWDRGTKFGLDTDGRTESILMSLPTDARWMYDHHPLVGSEEERTLNLLKKGINWATI